MPLVQFRVHPSVGIARMGDSDKLYYVAAEFPHFLQEEFPNLRLKPKPRTHPMSFFGSNLDSASADGGSPGSFRIYEAAAARQDKFRDATGKVLPQATRFRVFGYVYESGEAKRPSSIFEVTTAEADILWRVNIANKKSGKTDPSLPGKDKSGPNENSTGVPTLLDTTNTSLTCMRLRPRDFVRPGMRFPNLAYLFLERDDTNPAKVTGRLHVIGNEGEMDGFDNNPGGSAHPSRLWSNDWYDSAGDGIVEALITPKPGAAALLAKAGISHINDLKYLNQDVAEPQPGSLATITAAPAWVVVGCPDYSPDMGHFVTLWDVALSQSIYNVENKDVKKQPGKHKLVKCKAEIESFKKTDYLVHIHPQLCLFKDVRFVSGEAFGQREKDDVFIDRAHNKHPGGTAPAPTSDDDRTRKDKVEFGGLTLDPRADRSDMEDATKRKEKDPRKPINEWLKLALFMRLRKPQTVYRKKRKFRVHPPEASGDTLQEGMFPRKLGRRMDYDKPDGQGDKNRFYEFPDYNFIPADPGNLRPYRPQLKQHSGKLCGGPDSPAKLPASGTHPPGYDNAELAQLDDMFWPASFADMPLLRELAYTHLQYNDFQVWQGDPKTVRIDNIFNVLVSATLRASFAAAGDADKYFAAFLLERPLFAPAMIDMAHLGAMLGGSFLPGIEVGREGGVATNWCLFHGGSQYFPDIRFKPVRTSANHTLGTLTKDLAVPWTKDYYACDEEFWPTARMGKVSTDGVNRIDWLIPRSRKLPSLGRVRANEGEFVKEYWKAQGFVRRDASDRFIEQEAPWRSL